MSGIIEFQGFIGVNGYVVKELAIIDIHSKCCNTWLFKLPNRLLKTKDSSWLTDNYHGLDAYSGDVEYSQLEVILNRYTKNFNHLFTKGTGKVSFLNKLLPVKKCVVENLEMYGCPSLKKLTTNECCLLEAHFSSNLHCARKNCYKLADWCTKNNIS